MISNGDEKRNGFGEWFAKTFETAEWKWSGK